MSASEYGAPGKIMWVKVYDVTIDDHIAIPVRADGPVHVAIEVGQATPLTAAEAAALNTKHAGDRYVQEFVANRLQTLKAQGYEMPNEG